MPVASPVQFVRVSYGDSSAVAVKLILSSAVRMRTRFPFGHYVCTVECQNVGFIVEIYVIKNLPMGKKYHC